MAQLLLDAGANIEAVAIVSEVQRAWTNLISLDEQAIVPMGDEQGFGGARGPAVLDTTTWWLWLQDGKTPLYFAAEYDRASVVQLFLDAGANIEAVNPVREVQFSYMYPDSLHE